MISTAVPATYQQGEEAALLQKQASAGNPLAGVLLMMSGVLLFACLDTTTKYLASHYNVPVVMAVRYVVNCLLMVAIFAPRQAKQLVQTQRTGLVLIRAACLVVASLFLGLALQRMPVAETTAIIFLAPMVVVLIARPVLGERIGGLGWAAALIGFSGVLLIVRPGAGLDMTGTACLSITVAASVAYQMLSRVLASTEKTIALLFYTTLVGSISFGLLLPWFWGGPAPTPIEILLFLSLGLTGGLGHFLFTAAYRQAPASVLAPINYFQLVWAGLLGWVVFGHVPDGATLLGMGVVAASGAMVALRSARGRS